MEDSSNSGFVSSPRPLFRNVYKLVDRKTQAPVEEQLDIFDVLDSQQQSLYDVQAVSSRQSIRDRYDQMYHSIEKVPKPAWRK